MKRSNLLNRLTVLGLTTVMFGGILTGCADKSSSQSETTSSLSDSCITEQIVSSITQAIQQQTTTQVHPTPLAFNPEDYAGNLDAFVYGLLISEYELNYNVFQAGIELPDGTEVFGIGYTDYADYYKSDDGTGFFPAGFLALIGEPEIPEDAIEKGLEITDLEIEDSQSSFVLAYECEPFMEHCVIWGQYLQYGVNEHGTITYQTEEYQRGKCNESLGTLYSFDEQKNVFDPEVGTYVPITGISLNTQIDFSAIEEEMNRILENQDKNLVQSDIESSVYFAQEALKHYLLSLQTESFLGIPVDELIAQASELNPQDCIRITPDGTITVPLNGEIPKKPDLLTKWLVGIGTGIVVASTIAINIFVPASTPLTGSVASAAIDVFMQVVIENHTIEKVNWAKVAVAATSGALLAWACPLAAGQVTKLIGKEAVGKFAGYATLTLGTAVVSGATSAAMSYMDGKTSEDVLDSFVMGVAVGAACSIIIPLAGKALGAAGKGISKVAQKTKPGKWLAGKLNGIGEGIYAWIGKHQVHLKNQSIENILHPKSIQEAAREAYNTLKNEEAIKVATTLNSNDAIKAETTLNSIDQLPSDSNKFIHKIDENGMPISKSQLRNNGGNCYLECSDPNIKAEWESFGVEKIAVINGQPDLEPISYYTLNTPITGNREANYKDFLPKIAKDWNQNPTSIPKRVIDAIPENELKRIISSDSNNVTEMKNVLKMAKLTPHEVIKDGVGKVCLVDTTAHKIPHAGGVSIARAFAEAANCAKHIDELCSTKATNITGSLVGAF